MQTDSPPAEKYAEPPRPTPLATRYSPRDIARVCHMVNRAYCVALGDNSQMSWDDAPDWQKESALNGVRFVLDHPTAPASSNHQAWLEEKRKTGWRYGPVKDPIKKEHPCFVSYDDLPPDQRAKDHIFRAIVLELARF